MLTVLAIVAVAFVALLVAIAFAFRSETEERPGYIIPPATSAEGEVYTAGDWNRHLERSTR